VAMIAQRLTQHSVGRLQPSDTGTNGPPP
jgi:hypothetical protein